MMAPQPIAKRAGFFRESHLSIDASEKELVSIDRHDTKQEYPA